MRLTALSVILLWLTRFRGCFTPSPHTASLAVDTLPFLQGPCKADTADHLRPEGSLSSSDTPAVGRLCELAGAAVIKHHRQSNLNHRNILWRGLGGQRSEIRVSAASRFPCRLEGRVCPGLSPTCWQFLGLWQPNSSVPRASSCVPVCLHFPLYIRTPVILDLRPTLL